MQISWLGNERKKPNVVFLSLVRTMLCLFLRKPVEQSMIPVATQVITAVDPFKNQNDQDFS